MDSSSMSVENANEVMKYYDTSLKILNDLVNENEIKAVLGYLDQKMPVDSLPVVSPVSYTHLDVYKRQANSLELVDEVKNGTELNFDDFSLYVSVVKE